MTTERLRIYAKMSRIYAKFYQSGQYRRWSESRINKSRKCVYGHKIFTGSRQKEFVSRLLANVAEDLQADLLEVSKTYAMGNISIEKYVFNLKALVGMERLINAVAIGKGKRDLTCPSANISKSNQALNAYLDVPAGKAWSSPRISGTFYAVANDFLFFQLLRETA